MRSFPRHHLSSVSISTSGSYGSISGESSFTISVSSTATLTVGANASVTTGGDIEVKSEKYANKKSDFKVIAYCCSTAGEKIGNHNTPQMVFLLLIALLQAVPILAQVQLSQYTLSAMTMCLQQM